MALEPFTHPWSAAWLEALATSREFAEAARGFRGRVAFVVSSTFADGDGPAVAVEIEDGRCVAAAPVAVEEAQRARFALAADPATWQGVLDGSVDPAGAVLSGRIRLLRGSLFTIAPHLALARELLRAARRVGQRRHGASGNY